MDEETKFISAIPFGFLVVQVSSVCVVVCCSGCCGRTALSSWRSSFFTVVIVVVVVVMMPLCAVCVCELPSFGDEEESMLLLVCWMI